jgi:large subunit ribosomal protein L30
MSKKIKVTQIKSTIGTLEDQKRTVRALGLRKINRSVIHDDTPCIRGMVNTVKHLVKIEDIVGE